MSNTLSMTITFIVDSDIFALKKLIGSESKKSDVKETISVILSALETVYPDAWLARNCLLLKCLDLEYLSGIDHDLAIPIRDVIQNSDTVAISDIQRLLLGEAIKQIKKEGSTLFFDLSAFPDHESDTISTADRIRTRRLDLSINVLRKQIDSSLDRELSDIIDIWLTHHGFRALMDLGIGRFAGREELQLVLDALDSQARDIKTELNPRLEYSISFSSENPLHETIEGIALVSGGYTLGRVQDQNWIFPNAGQILDTISVLELSGVNTYHTLPLDILSATWLFPRGEKLGWIIQKRILRNYQDDASPSEVRKISRFLQTLDCSEEASCVTSRENLAESIRIHRIAEAEDTYRLLLKHFSCLGKNEKSVIGLYAAQYIQDHFLEKFASDMPFNDGVGWLKRLIKFKETDIWSIIELRNLILNAYYLQMKTTPKSASHWVDLMCDCGEKLVESGDLTSGLLPFKALLDYQDNLINDSTIALANNNYAYILTELDRFDDALPYSQKAVETNPKSCHGWHTYGVIMHKNRNWELAEESYRKSLDCDQTHWDAWDDLIRLFEELENESKLREIRKDYEQIQSKRKVETKRGTLKQIKL